MDDAKFEEKLESLLQGASAFPPAQQDKVINLANKSKVYHDRLQQKLASLQQSLDYLRLSVKYLIFDLEATRRENVELRRRLNDAKGRPDTDY